MQNVFKINNVSLDEYLLNCDMHSLEKLYGATKTIVFGYAFSILKNVNDSEENVSNLE